MGAFKNWMVAAIITAWVMAMETSADVGALRGSEEYTRRERDLGAMESAKAQKKTKKQTKSPKKTSPTKKATKTSPTKKAVKVGKTIPV